MRKNSLTYRFTNIYDTKYILNHLKTDKTINRLFYEKDDYYLQNLLCGKLEKMDYIN